MHCAVLPCVIVIVLAQISVVASAGDLADIFVVQMSADAPETRAAAVYSMAQVLLNREVLDAVCDSSGGWGLGWVVVWVGGRAWRLDGQACGVLMATATILETDQGCTGSCLSLLSCQAADTVTRRVAWSSGIRQTAT